ncbi:YoaK family protein [Solibaculum mannosilyticum]|uniref:Membrane protein n=1 Tax=Solibaculum mannosilyticum TaxID=2780922 RepID=A0A7I8D1K3_9FIRM|nr:YoaK family protein [Solibaculum mannosilyticum]BCI60690.1 membrane protein [Solibaculum mannosilyticum]
MKSSIERQKKRWMTQSYFLGSMLAAVGGFLDAYTYILRGGVFANAQTGNIVLLGFNLAQWNLGQVLYDLVPIGAFAVGIIASEFIRRRFQRYRILHWRQLIVAAECLVLVGVAFIPLGDGDVLANIVISFLCAMQVEAFQTVDGQVVSTIMCTGNLRSATESIYRYRVRGNKEDRTKGLKYYGIVLFFAAGALVGTLLSNALGEKAVLFCCILLGAGFVSFYFRDKPLREKVEQVEK